MAANVYDWLTKWFSAHGNAVSLGDNYFEKGYVDSLGLIVMIGEIEEHFGIQFSNDQFTDKSFATVSGLAEAIKKRIGDENGDGRRDQVQQVD